MLTETKLKKLNKQIDMSIEKYWCSVCERFHKRRFRNNLSKTFFNHIDFKSDITTTELFKRDFKKKWRKHALKQHKKEYEVSF